MYNFSEAWNLSIPSVRTSPIPITGTVLGRHFLQIETVTYMFLSANAPLFPPRFPSHEFESLGPASAWQHAAASSTQWPLSCQMALASTAEVGDKVGGVAAGASKSARGFSPTLAIVLNWSCLLQSEEQEQQLAGMEGMQFGPSLSLGFVLLS